MGVPKIVIDTNVLVAALKSQRGAAFKLLSMVGNGEFQVCVSVPLIIEYEDVLNRTELNLHLDEDDIGEVLDYLCRVADRRKIFYLWRPFLKDPKDDHILELAVESGSDFIVTYNLRDFAGIEKFAIEALHPAEFLTKIGV